MEEDDIISRDNDDGKYDGLHDPDAIMAMEAADRYGDKGVQAHPARALMLHLMELAEYEHPKAVEYAVPILGRLLTWPAVAVVEVALCGGADRLLVERFMSSGSLSYNGRRGTLAALAAWAEIGYGTESLHENYDLVAHLIAMAMAANTETDHRTLHLTYTLLKPLVAQPPAALDWGTVDQVMTRIVSTAGYCDQDMNHMCRIRRNQLHLVAELVTVASAACDLDILADLADRGLGAWMAHVQEMEIVPETDFRELEPILRVIRAYQQSGVDSDPIWGCRAKVKTGAAWVW
ncbi:hypothetical protein BC828DRAFT_418805 [Blastocladiella britannica]|nr:hypothetical protein BC828DRAFT_418805 [Blastocladiella britannica]